MRKIIYILGLLTILSGCGGNCIELPKKINYLKIGLDDKPDVYLRVEGSGKFSIGYGDLLQFKTQNCESHEIIASDVRYFSVISEEEYNKNMGIEHTLTETQNLNIDTNLTY